MKKTILVFLVTFSLILGSFGQIEVSAQPQTIIVPDDFPTIVEAINNASEGDTFTISGTRHDGDSVSGTYTIGSGDTVQDLLSEIQTIFGSSVTATIDDSGAIVVTDVDTGTSHLDISITANNEGGGSIDMGTMDLSQSGRYQVAITASNENGYLKFTHDDYGSENGFSISQSANYLGILLHQCCRRLGIWRCDAGAT